MNRRCVALLSGGLDSTLAVLLLREQGIEVIALRFMTHFGCGAGEGSSCGHDVTHLAKRFGFTIKLCHLGEEYVEMVRKPKHGWGKNMNPCIDCRIMMLRYAKDYMAAADASFVVTGEVLNQRPMSQRRQPMDQVVKETGLEGILLRPLSAKLLEPTEPEKAGAVDRERLMGIHGRSRREQVELAARFGLTDYAQPSGGCYLTDPIFSDKLRDLFAHTTGAPTDDINLLHVGRHFRLDGKTKVVVGRNEKENDRLRTELAKPGDALLELHDGVGPLTLLRGETTPESLQTAAGLVVKHSKAAKLGAVDVDARFVQSDGKVSGSVVLRAPALAQDEVEELRIVKSGAVAAAVGSGGSE